MMVNVQETWEQLVERQKREGGMLDRMIESMARMEESHRREAMMNYEKKHAGRMVAVRGGYLGIGGEES